MHQFQPNPLTKFTSSNGSTGYKDILPWNISQMITKDPPNQHENSHKLCGETGNPLWIWWKVNGNWNNFQNSWHGFQKCWNIHEFLHARTWNTSNGRDGLKKGFGYRWKFLVNISLFCILDQLSHYCYLFLKTKFKPSIFRWNLSKGIQQMIPKCSIKYYMKIHYLNSTFQKFFIESLRGDLSHERLLVCYSLDLGVLQYPYYVSGFIKSGWHAD